MFRIGQKVVCVDDSCPEPSYRDKVSCWVKKGQIYTIRRILPPERFHTTAPGLALYEIIGKSNPYWGDEYGWRSERFRPIEERKTDISIFTEMLNTKKIKEKA